MDATRKLVLVVLCVVLFGALMTANIVWAADQTVMDDEYAATTAEEEGLVEALVDEIDDEIENEIDGDDDLPIESSVEEIVSEAVAEDHVEAELDANLERFYAYLHGDVDELRLEIDTEPIRTSAVEIVEAEAADVELSDLEIEQATEIERMAESEEQFAAEREAFEEQEKERIQFETDSELTEPELEAAYEDQRDEIREQAHDQQREEIDSQLQESDAPESFQEPLETLSLAYVDALTGFMEYDEYATTVETETEAIQAAIVDEFEAELDDELDERIDLTAEFDDDELSDVESAQTGVSTVSTLTLLAPLIAVAAAGAIVWAVPASVAAISIGVASSVAGISGFAASRIGSGVAERALESADPPSTVEGFLQALFDALFGAVTTHSTIVLVGGLVLVGLGIAIRRDLLPVDLDLE